MNFTHPYSANGARICTMILICFVLLLPGCDFRMVQIQNTTDQNFLAKEAMEGKTATLRMAAVERITDQMLLERVAITRNFWEVRKVAIEKLTDQMLWERLAMDDRTPPDVRTVAIEKLTDQTVLAD